MKYFYYIYKMGLFNKLFKKNTNRVYLKDVVPGQSIKVEWSRMTSKIGFVTCVNNDPKTKRMMIKIEWSNWETAGCEQFEEHIWGYNEEYFENFHLLNELRINKPVVIEEPDEQEKNEDPIIL